MSDMQIPRKVQDFGAHILSYRATSGFLYKSLDGMRAVFPGRTTEGDGKFSQRVHEVHDELVAFTLVMNPQTISSLGSSHPSDKTLTGSFTKFLSEQGIKFGVEDIRPYDGGGNLTDDANLV